MRVQVSGEAQGAPEKMKVSGREAPSASGLVSGAGQEFVGHLNQGPTSAKVSKVEQKDISVKSDEVGFTSS